MADVMLQALLNHFHQRGFKGTEDYSRTMTFMLKNGVVVNGAMISPEHFGRLNSEENGGTCPKDFSFKDELPDSHVHLANVQILTQSGAWTPIGTLRLPADDISCCGDIFSPAPPPKS